MKDAGTATHGATENSLGEASMSDLDKGFYGAGDKSKERNTVFDLMDIESQAGGFCGRPSGYER